MSQQVAQLDEEDLTLPEPMAARVLVAEDDLELRGLVVWLLHQDGHRITGVDGGLPMLQALNDESQAEFPRAAFDLIISDVRMPGLSGMEVIKRLRGSGCATPVIAMTAFPSQALRAEAAVLDVVVLPKPFQLETLRSTVHSQLSNTQPRGTRHWVRERY
jgi:DNA-binding response OmpR family regulator